MTKKTIAPKHDLKKSKKIKKHKKKTIQNGIITNAFLNLLFISNSFSSSMLSHP